MTNALATIDENFLSNLTEHTEHVEEFPQYLTMDANNGEWLHGGEPLAQRMAVVDITSWMVGYFCWNDQNAAPEKELGSIGERRIQYENLPEISHLTRDNKPAEWVPAHEVSILVWEGGRAKTANFSTSSMGGVEGLGKLMRQLIAQLKQDSDNKFPVVELTSSSYWNKKRRKDTFKPMFKVVDWVDTCTYPEFEDEPIQVEAVIVEPEAEPVQPRRPIRRAKQ